RAGPARRPPAGAGGGPKGHDVPADRAQVSDGGRHLIRRSPEDSSITGRWLSATQRGCLLPISRCTRGAPFQPMPESTSHARRAARALVVVVPASAVLGLVPV